MKGNIIEKTIKVSGMSCQSCERTLTSAIKGLPGVKAVKVSYVTSLIKVKYDEALVQYKDIIQAIENAGYSTSNKENKQLIVIGIWLLALYLIIDVTIGFDFVPELNQNASYALLFIIGFLSSFHCIAMCGGINLSQCLATEFPNSADKLKTIQPSFLYNVGRVVSYTFIGGLVGGLGSVISFSTHATNMISILAGFFMIVLGLKMLDVIPALRKLNLSVAMPKKLKDHVNQQKKTSSPFYVGLLNGLMPCGPLQTMQLYALGTGSILAGALSMFFFSIGTLPIMFGFGVIGSFITGKYKQKLTKFSAILVVVLGVIMANRGLNFDIFGLFDAKATGTYATLKDNYQYVETKFENGNYEPIVVQKGVKVIWDIYIEPQDINGCNKIIIIPKYGIQHQLTPGYNRIEFTPIESGNISYYCYMRMLRSKITIVDDLTGN